MSKFICEKCQSSSTCQLYQVSQRDSLRPIKSCYQFKKRKPTNADRIRAMSDEELAKIIEPGVDCHNCPAKSTACEEHYEDEPPPECWELIARWLKQEEDEK